MYFLQFVWFTRIEYMLSLFDQVYWQPTDGSDYEHLNEELECYSTHHYVLFQEDCCEKVEDQR